MAKYFYECDRYGIDVCDDIWYLDEDYYGSRKFIGSADNYLDGMQLLINAGLVDIEGSGGYELEYIDEVLNGAFNIHDAVYFDLSD